jgi:hypothetical protein
MAGDPAPRPQHGHAGELLGLPRCYRGFEELDYPLYDRTT